MQIVINRLRYAPMRSHSSFDSEEVRLNQAKRHRGFLPTRGRRERGEQGEDEKKLVLGLSLRGAEMRRRLAVKSLNCCQGEQEGRFCVFTVSGWLLCRYSKDKGKEQHRASGGFRVAN